jgi:uncharacterized protein YjbJ (UPF0337 family)
MNWDTVKGDWKQFKGKVKEQWGKLTDEDLTRIEGRRDQLAGAIQKRYGIEKDEADKQVTAFEQKCGECDDEGNRTTMETRGGAHEKNVAGQHSMNHPSKDKSESAPMRQDSRRQEEHSAPANNPKVHKEQGGSGERMKDRDMATGEKKMEGKPPAGGQQQHSQTPRAKK